MTATVTLRIIGENGQAVGSIRVAKQALGELGKEAVSAGQQAAQGATQIEKVGEASERTNRRARAARSTIREFRQAMAELAQTQRATAQAAELLANKVDRIGQASERTRQRTSGLLGGLGQLKGLLAGFGALQAGTALVRSVDTYSDVIGKLEQVTDSEEALSKAKAESFEIANKYYQQLDATVTLYGRSSRALEQYGYSQAKAAELTETLAAGLLLDRASASESASAILQFSQALNSGVLRAEEFNTVNEAAPSIMRALADSLGVPVGALKKMAEEGKLTIAVLVEAMTGAQAQKIREEASDVPLTISRAWQVARNDLVKFFGEADQSIGASRALAGVIAFLGGNIAAIATVAAIAGVGYTLRLILPLRAGLAVWIASTAETLRYQMALLSMQGVTGRAAVGQLALAASSRVAGAAMAFVGGPIGAAVLGLTALVYWLATAGDRSEETAQQIATNFRSAKQALDDFNKAPSSTGFGDLADADVSSKITEAKKQLESLKDAASNAQGAYERSLARMGDAGGGMAARLAVATEAVENQRLRVNELDQSYAKAVRSGADLIIGAVKLGNVSEDERKQIEGLVIELEKSKLSFDTARPKIVALMNSLRGAGAAARATAASFYEMKAAAGDTEYLDKMSENLAKQQVRLRGIQQGARAGSRMEFGFQIIEDQKKRGQPFSSTELAARYRAWQQVADATDTADAAQKRATESTKAAGRGMRELEKDTKRASDEAKRLAEARAAFALENQSLAADQAGPLARARFDYDDSLRQARDAQRTGEASPDDLRQREALLEKQYESTTAEIQKRQDVLGALRERYREELALSGMTAEARRVEEEVIRAVNEAKEASKPLNDLEIADLKRFVRESQAVIAAREALQQLSEAQANEIDQLRATVSSGGQLTAVMKAEIAIRKSLTGLTEQQIKLRQKEVESIRAQAREIDTLNAQQGIQSTIRDIFNGAIDGQQQGRSPWESFRNEGLRALVDIGKKFRDITKSTGDWRKSLVKTGEAIKEILPELGQLAGTLAGGGGKGAALGSSIGGLIGSYFGGVIGSVIGSIIGGWAGGTFDEDPNIRVGNTVSKPEQTRTSRFQTFQVRTESMTEPTSGAVADAIVEFDALIYDMMTAGQRAAVRATLQNWSGNAPVLSDLMKSRMRAVLGSLDKVIGDFVLNSSTDLQRQMQNLSEVLELKRLTGTLERALRLIEEFGRAGESAGQTYQRLGQLAESYGVMMTDVNRQVLSSGMNEFQKKQVEIELQYRAQIRQANELAKAFGLSGARAEDLAKIEELRAINMAALQRQMEDERNRVLTDLSLSDLSPLRDDQKLGQSMQELRQAVASGDLARAEQLAQTALGFGRNLFASGADYNSLYGEVTGLLRQVGLSETQTYSETQLGTIADLLEGLPEQIARSMFNALYGTLPSITSPASAPVLLPVPSTNTSQSGNALGTNTPPLNEVLNQLLKRVEAIEMNTASAAKTNAAMANTDAARELSGIGTDR